MSIVCTTPMCEAGSASVEQMRQTFNSLSADVSQHFDASRFRSTVDSIEASFNAEYSWYDPLIPFNPVCCTIEKIGQQADLITNQMLESVGASGIPGPSTASMDPLLMLGFLVVGYLIFREIKH